MVIEKKRKKDYNSLILFAIRSRPSYCLDVRIRWAFR